MKTARRLVKTTRVIRGRALRGSTNVEIAEKSVSRTRTRPARNAKIGPMPCMGFSAAIISGLASPPWSGWAVLPAQAPKLRPERYDIGADRSSRHRTASRCQDQRHPESDSQPFPCSAVYLAIGSVDVQPEHRDEQPQQQLEDRTAVAAGSARGPDRVRPRPRR